jgi:hypothetical protein
MLDEILNPLPQKDNVVAFNREEREMEPGKP